MHNTIKIYGRLMRFHRPVGIFLLLWPTLWAVWIAGNGHPSWHIVLIFVSGVILMRAAGCIINDIADRKLDGFVKRTKDRPLVTQEISVKHALWIVVFLCLIAFGFVLFLNVKTVLLAIIALLLSSLYPFMKRYTHLPQLLLGIAWYIGMLMAFTAQLNKIPLVGWLLYSSAILWTVAYDTIYAMVDRGDDLQVGIKSTAILFGRWDRFCIAVLQGATIFLLLLVGHLLLANWIYYLSIAIASLLFSYQQWLIKDRQEAACLKAFVNNQFVGLVVFLGVLGNFIFFG